MDIQICDKLNLTIKEASSYSGIGEKKIRELVRKKNCPFVIRNGSKYLIKRVKFEEWLENVIFL